MIRKKKDHIKAVYWIQACALLHNICLNDRLLLANEEIFISDSLIVDDVSADSQLNPENIGTDRIGKEKRERLKEKVLNFCI